MILGHTLKLTDADVLHLRQLIPKDKKIHQMMAEINKDASESGNKDD